MKAKVILILWFIFMILIISASRGQTAEDRLVAKYMVFDKQSITVPADSMVTIGFDNQDSGIPHNFAVYADSSGSDIIFKGDIITGPAIKAYIFKAPHKSGAYLFRCDIHPQQETGKFIVTKSADENIENESSKNERSKSESSKNESPKKAADGQITDVTWPAKDTYEHTEPIPVSVNFANTGSQAYSFWIGYSVQDSSGKWWYAPAQQTSTLQPGANGVLKLQWQPPETAPEGAYTAAVALCKDYNTDYGLLGGEIDRKIRDSAFRLSHVSEFRGNISQAQAPVGWNRTFGGYGDYKGNSVQQTNDDGYIITGIIYSADGPDAWLIKTDSQGNKLWDKTFGGSDWDVGNSVQQTSDGGYIITGGTKSFGADENDAWLIKTDSQGNKLWDKTFGGPDWDVGNSVRQTSDGGYIITGGTRSFGAGGDNAWLIKTDSQGNKLWDKVFGRSGADLSNWVQQTSDGGYIITGFTGSYGAGGDDAWLIKTDSQGNKLWDKTFGGSDWDVGNSVQQTSDGGYIITGGTKSFGADENDAWLIKTDSQGNKLWDKTFGGLLGDSGKSAQQTSDGGYILTGGTQSHGAGYYDAWLIKTDSQGNKLWDKTFGGPWNDWGYSVQQTNDGGYIITGETKSYGSGKVNAWLIKTDATGNEAASKPNTTNARNIIINESANPSRKVLEKAADAIESGDKAEFLDTLSNDTLNKFNGKLDLSTPQAAKVAEGLRGAKVVDQRDDLVVYEMVVDGNESSFFAIKEDGAWKISGL